MKAGPTQTPVSTLTLHHCSIHAWRFSSVLVPDTCGVSRRVDRGSKLCRVFLRGGGCIKAEEVCQLVLILSILNTHECVQKPSPLHHESKQKRSLRQTHK